MRARRFVAAASALVAATIVATVTPNAMAFNTWSNRHLIYGVSGQQYWIGPSAAQHHGTAIPNAVQRWNNAVGIVSYTRTNVKANSRLDFTRIDTNDNACAVTWHFVDTTRVNDANGTPTRNWAWAKVQIRPQLADAGACGPADHRGGVLAHEMGHAMGLAHRTDQSQVLMNNKIAWSGWYDVNTPRQDDINGVNFLY